MSGYDDDRRHRNKDRDRRQDQSPVYEEEEIIQARKGPKGTAMNRGPAPRRNRRGSSDSYTSSSTEEIRRDFPPAGAHDKRGGNSRRSKPAKDDRRSRRYDDSDSYDSYDDKPRRRDRGSRRKYSSSESSSPSPRRDKSRRKSTGEHALEALGLGGAAAAALGRSKSHDRGRDNRKDRRSRRYSSSDSDRSRSRGRDDRGGDQKDKLIQAAKAAVIAGGTEAWRMRKEPGGWGGPKGRRVLTAAVGAAGVNKLIDKDPSKGSTRHTIESVIGGLAGNRLINGSRSADQSRSRSRGRGHDDRDGGGGGGGGGGLLGGLSAAALATSAAKAFTNRSKSRGRDRRDYSSSEDDRGYGRGGRRSKSVSDYMRQGMAKIGIGGNSDQRDAIDGDTANRSLEDLNRGPPPPPYYPEQGGAPYPAREQQQGAPYQTRDLQQGGAPYQPRDLQQGGAPYQPRNSSVLPGGRTESLDYNSSEESISSSEEERERKKLGKKQLLTAGLASVATIHAAHNVYQSYHARQVRAKEVRKGEMSPREARNKKNKARLQDVASVGIAAIGLKSAYGEWKEAKEQRDEVKRFDQERIKRHERRALRSQHASEMGSNGDSLSTQSQTAYANQPAAYSSANLHPAAPGLYAPAYDPQYRSSAPDLGRADVSLPPEPHPDAPYYTDGNPFHMSGALVPPDIPHPPGASPPLH